MQLNNMEIIDLTKKRMEDLLATLKNIEGGFNYVNIKLDVKSVMFSRFDEAYAELKARFFR